LIHPSRRGIMKTNVTWLILFILVGAINVCHAQDCPALPKRNANIEEFAQHLLKSGFQLQGVKYDRNPPRDLTFSQMNQIQRNLLKTMRSADPDSFQERPITYYLDSANTQDPSLISIPRNRFWCLVRPGNMVLLTDGITHHYTTVYAKDTQKQTIDFIDSWPDKKLFLRQGKSGRTINAQIIPVPESGKLVRITRKEFERVIIGSSSNESKAFIRQLPDLFPERAINPHFMLAIAINVLGDTGEETPIAAIPYYQTALSLALSSTDTKLRQKVTTETYYVVRLSRYWIDGGGVAPSELTSTRQAVEILHQQIQTHFANNITITSLNENQLIRLGQLAWQLYQLREAENLFSLVIKNSPNNPEGYFGRAKARNRLLDHAGTINDSSKTINLIEQTLTQGKMTTSLQEGMSVYEIRDYLNSTPERHKMFFMWGEAYFLRGNAYNTTDQSQKAEKDGRALIAINADDFQGYIVVATALIKREQYRQAASYYDAAIALAPSPRLKLSLEQIKQSIGEKAKATQPELTLGYLESLLVTHSFVFKDNRSLEEFVEKSTSGVAPDQLTYTWQCFVPNGAPAVTSGQDEAGNVRVEVDMSLARGRWSPSVSEETKSNFICRGIVLSDGFASASSWRTKE